MITKVKIQGFQSHEDTEIDLHPGFNVITGASDSGKSAIVKAIDLVVENRPLGWEYKSWHSDQTSVEITFPEGSVERGRTKKINAYIINGHQMYEAVKASIPPQVKNLMRMDKLNIQSQHDPYFLLQSSSGDVAAKMNEVAGLEIIDKLTSSIEQIVRKTSTDLSYQQETVAKLYEEAGKYAYLDDLMPLVEKFSNEWSLYQDGLNVIKILSGKIKEYEEAKSNHEAVCDFLAEVELPYLSLKNKLEEAKELFSQYVTLDGMILNYEALEVEVAKKCAVLEKVTPLYQKATEAIKEYKVLMTQITNLSQSIASYDYARAKAIGHGQQLDEAVEIYKQLLLEHKTCPICLTTLTEQHIKEVVEGL